MDWFSSNVWWIRWIFFVDHLLQQGDVTFNLLHLYVCVTWLIYTCDSHYSCLNHVKCIYINESRRIYEWILYDWGTLHTNEFIYLCDMTHLYMWLPSFVCNVPQSCQMYIYKWVTSHIWMNSIWLRHVAHEWIHSFVWRDSFICVPWLVHMCAMMNSYVWHDSFICEVWLIHMFDMTHSCVTWLIHICDVTHSYVWRDSFIYVI